MKILVVGDWHSELHEEAVFGAFQKLGHEVFRFAWHQYFHYNENAYLSWFSSLYYKFQNKYLFGPILGKINRDLIKKVSDVHPDFIFVYRGTHIFPSTLRQIKKLYPKTILAGYNNDDPFSKHYGSALWRHFLRAVPKYDVVFAYRNENLKELKSLGVKRAYLLRSWYVPDVHKKIGFMGENTLKYTCDCVFIGHFENDGRDKCIEFLLKNKVNVKVFGPYKGMKNSGWFLPVSKSKILRNLLPITYLYGKSYVYAINATPIALCFLSKINRDTYTRRCFEIPAMGAALFSEYSVDLDNMFTDGVDAVFFRNKEELLEKIQYYMINQNELNEIRRRGMKRVKSDGHDIYSRMQYLIDLLPKL